MAADLFPDGRPDWAEGYIAAKRLDDVEWLVIAPLTFDRARLCVATEDTPGVEQWCMDSPAEALMAWVLWPARPMRWNRHLRRDGVQEYPDGRTDLEEGGR